jgi:hypothetical protein
MKKRAALTNFSRIGLMMFFIISFIACDKSVPGNDDLGPFNINVTLLPVDLKTGGGLEQGFIKFRQDPDTNRIITLDTYVANLKPNHDYLLQRAVNPITDADCTSTAWLTLGKGLVAQSIHTDGRGDGHELLFRDITSIARGTTFRIHFQIIDAVTMDPVLNSDCDQYTVR